MSVCGSLSAFSLQATKRSGEETTPHAYTFWSFVVLVLVWRFLVVMFSILFSFPLKLSFCLGSFSLGRTLGETAVGWHSGLHSFVCFGWKPRTVFFVLLCFNPLE